MLDLSVVIPSLNAGASLGATLAALTWRDQAPIHPPPFPSPSGGEGKEEARAHPASRSPLKGEGGVGVISVSEDQRLNLEVIVVDGGSSDATIEIARAGGARVVSAPRGRGTQLRHGAEDARASWLLFLHADTVLAPNWTEAARGFMANAANQQRAACFRLALDDARWIARWLERIVVWRTRALGLPYGDQGLLISRALYELLGGYRPLPIMEDVDLVRRIGRRRLTRLDVSARTSAVRYRQGYMARSLRNLCCLALYYVGVSPALIARFYEGHQRP